MWTLADFDKTRWVERNLSAFFVAKHGDDRNDGHPRRPVASIGRGVNLANAAGQTMWVDGYSLRPVVIGSGTYSEASIVGPVVLIGDGQVVLDGAGATQLFSNTYYVYYPNGLSRITVQNYVSLGLRLARFSNVRVYNCNYLSSGDYQSHSWHLVNTLLVNTPQLPLVQGIVLELLLQNCSLINSRFLSGQGDNNFRNSAGFVLRNTYLDANSYVDAPAGAPFRVTNCNVQGFLARQRLADFQLQTNNSATDCLSVEPGFNNPAAQDYTLATTSAMRNLAFDGGFCGAYGIGINFSGLADADTLTNAQWNSTLGAFVLTDQSQRGIVEFVVKDFMRNWILNESLLVGQEDNVDHQTIDATLSYDVDGFGAPANVQSGGLLSGYSYWISGYDKVTYQGQDYTDGQFFAVTDELTYTVSGTGKVVKLLEAPNIRLYEMKFSVTSAVDCVSRPWQYFVFNKVPTVDAAGRSNGDPQFDPATANPITVRYLKLRLTMMPNSLA